MGSETLVRSYPPKRHDVKRVFSAVNGIQEVAVGDLGTSKHPQLAAEEPNKNQNEKLKELNRSMRNTFMFLDFLQCRIPLHENFHFINTDNIKSFGIIIYLFTIKWGIENVLLCS